MNLPENAKQRLIRDLLADALEAIEESRLENRRLKRLIVVKDAQIALLNQRRADFDMSADADLPALLRPQFG